MAGRCQGARPFLMTQQATLTLNEPRVALALFGTRDQHLHAIRDQLGVTITHRDGELRVTGSEEAVLKAGISGNE